MILRPGHPCTLLVLSESPTRVYDDGAHIHDNDTDDNTKQNQRDVILLECCERVLFLERRGGKHIPVYPGLLLLRLVPCRAAVIGLTCGGGRQRGAS